MAEYIERKKLYNNLVLLAKYETGERQQGILGCTETVRIFPAADVVPVVHGQWLRSDDDWGSLTSIRCSICGEEWCFEMIDDVTLLNYKYCPNCGARMDGGGGNSDICSKTI